MTEATTPAPATTIDRYEFAYSLAVFGRTASDALHAYEEATGTRVTRDEWLDLFAGWEAGRADRGGYERDMREGADEVTATTGEGTRDAQAEGRA